MKESEILERYYRGYAKIDLDCIYENVLSMKANIPKGTDMAAVIKTDGYGHGAVPIAKTLQSVVKAFAVATIDEGMNLRQHGIKNDIYILGYTHPSRFADCIEEQIRPAVFTYEMAEALSKTAETLGKPAKIHIKVDTGMGRIGFLVNQKSVEEVIAISRLEGLVLEGIFTHYATADSKDKHNTQKQYEKFIWFIKKLEQAGVHFAVKHCDNSAGIIDLPDYSMDLVRAGIALYGMYPSDDVNKPAVCLKPALSLKSHIIYLKEVEAGTAIGYGGTFVTKRRTKVATIPLGYGDGYQRNLTNKGEVLIHGQRAGIIGKVCMDQFMIDVTDIEEVCEGDEVTLIGRDGEDCITVEEVAELSGSYMYEFVCDLGKRVPRVFYRNGKIVCHKDYFMDSYDFSE